MKVFLSQSGSRPRPISRYSGYTLLELLIVIGVLGLAGALLVPRLSEPDTLAIQGAARRVISDLGFAQSDALARQEFRRVHFFDDGRGYVILRPPFDPETDFIFDPLSSGGFDGAYIVDFTTDRRFRDIDIESVSIDGGDEFITYDELGGTVADDNSPGTGGTIVMRSPNARYRINIAPFTGKLTIERLSP